MSVLYVCCGGGRRGPELAVSWPSSGARPGGEERVCVPSANRGGAVMKEVFSMALSNEIANEWNE